MPPSQRQALHALRWRTAMLSLAVGCVMLVIKVGAWLATGSVAIMADASESVVHVVTTVIMVWSMRLMLQPPDREHPYGHGRIEHFSIGFEGGMVALAGLAIIGITSYQLVMGYEPSQLGWGFAAMCAAAAINLALGAYLVWVGKRSRTPILVADGVHVLSDVWTSAGVAVGLLVVWLTGLVVLDAVIAYMVAAYILWQGIRLVRGAFAGLLDEVDPAVVEGVITVLNQRREEDWIDVHGLRARRAGDDVHIDFHLVVPGERTVREMHGQLDLLEAAILEHLHGRGSVLVHLDHPAAGTGPSQWQDSYPGYGAAFTPENCLRLAAINQGDGVSSHD